MKIIQLIIMVLVLLPCYVNAEEWRIDTKTADLNSNCELTKSEIITKLTGGCGGHDYSATEKTLFKDFQKDHLSYHILDWQEFLKFKKDSFTSKYFETITKDYFKDNSLGAVYLMYAGSRFIKNAKLTKTNGSCAFSYEVWDRKMEAYPACVWENLYLIKLKDK